MTHPYWPLFDLTIITPILRLRPMTEADQAGIAERLPPDLDLSPALPHYDLGSDRASRGASVFQGYWRAWGTWTPESWALPFAVFRGDELIGSQVLEGDDFLQKRVVDSASFLFPELRGHGYGKEMRRAMLALAFADLGAEWAVTSAWTDNAASLGVSRALGYELNGESRHAYEGRVGILTHLKLTRERWAGSGLADGIAVDGFAPCRPLFGLT